MTQMAPVRPQVLILALLILVQGLAAQDKALFGKVTFPLGTVQVRGVPSAEWKKVVLNQDVFVGESVRTLAKSRCEITLNGGGKFRIAEKSETVLTQANVTPLKKEFGATVSSGQVWVAAKAAFGETKNVAVRTPTAVAAIRGTKYRAVAGQEESSVLVYDGKVDVNWAEMVPVGGGGGGGQGGAPSPMKIGPPQQIAPPTQVPGPYQITLDEWITLVAGMQINVRADGKYNMFEFDRAADAGLEFVRWNMELDEQQGE